MQQAALELHSHKISCFPLAWTYYPSTTFCSFSARNCLPLWSSVQLIPDASVLFNSQQF